MTQNLDPQAYLNVSVDKLFEDHTVSEVEQIHTKLQNEVDAKKMEIRGFVGERYRDLIEAADTITDMRDTASELTGHIIRLHTSSTDFIKPEKIGFRNEVSPKVRDSRQKRARFYGIILQVKILNIVPEMIWKCLETEDYFIATQLFVFSRHIVTGLQVEVNADIVNKLPVIQTFWDSISPFFVIIKEKCRLALENENLNQETAARCLASIQLLENCDLNRLINILIEGRSKSFQEILSPESKKYEKSRDKILASLRVLIKAAELLHNCFLDNAGTGKGLLYYEIKLLQSSSPTVELILDQNDPKLRFLPDIVSKFRPDITLAQPNEGQVSPVLNHWLQFIQVTTESQVGQVVLLITTIKTIQDVKKQALSLEKAENWENICKNLGLPDSLDFYTRFYSKLVDYRLQQIIEDAWQVALKETVADIETVQSQFVKNKANLRAWMWKEEEDDCPRSLKMALEVSSEQKKLLMKVYGFTPEVVDLCMKFDLKLGTLFKDVKSYLSKEHDLIAGGDSTDEPEGIGIFLNDCSRENLSNLITEIKSLKVSDNAEANILLARILYAIPQLCPNLRSCLSATSLSLSTWTDGSVNAELYSKTCQLLNEESINFWKLWLTQFIEQLETKLKKAEPDFNSMLREFPNWDIITIEEKDEQDNAVESTIRVPSKPSFPLQRFFHETCTALNEVIPHTVPKLIAANLSQQVAECLHRYYKALADVEFVKNNQNTALQYYFDLKFINYILVPKDNKLLLESYQTLILEYKNFIDPFDFDVFYPYVNENVKKSGQQMQYQFGCLTASGESTITIQTVGGVKQERDPNVLALSSDATTITWFPLLPISDHSSDSASQLATLQSVASTGKISSMIDGDKVMTSSKSSTSLDKTLRTAQNYADNVKSGAAALFNDWFKS